MKFSTLTALATLVAATAGFADMGSRLPTKFENESIGTKVDITPFTHFYGYCYVVFELSNQVTCSETADIITNVNCDLKLLRVEGPEIRSLCATILPEGSTSFVANAGMAVVNGNLVAADTNTTAQYIVCGTSADNITNKVQKVVKSGLKTFICPEYEDLYRARYAKFKSEYKPTPEELAAQKRAQLEQEQRKRDQEAENQQEIERSNQNKVVQPQPTKKDRPTTEKNKTTTKQTTLSGAKTLPKNKVDRSNIGDF